MNIHLNNEKELPLLQKYFMYKNFEKDGHFNKESIVLLKNKFN